MKIVRFLKEQQTGYGIMEGKVVKALEGEPFDSFRMSGKEYRLDEVKLLAPCIPSKIVAIGLNYRSHALETNNPVPSTPIIFLKPPTSLIGPEETIVLPPDSTRIDYECELAIVMKKKARFVTAEEAPDYVLGYTCFNDVTARDHQRDDVQWTRGKGHDTFGPIGPCIETDMDTSNIALSTWVNGQMKQQGNTSDLIFPVPDIIEFVSGVMTLLPGDVIATGTPAGIGRIVSGDVVEIRIDPIGVLKNYVQ